MRKNKIKLMLLLTIVCFGIIGCVRTYPNGDTEEIGWFDKTIDLIGGTPEREVKKLIPKEKLTGDEKKDAAIKLKNQQIEEDNEKIKEHNKGAQHDKENPTSGILITLTTLTTAFGYGWVNAVLKKKNFERLRGVAEEGEIIANTRYQAIKEGTRGNVSLLDEIKVYASEGVKFANENMALLKKNKEAIKGFKAIVKEGLKKPA